MSSEESPIKDRQIGDYLIKESIGNGGFAKVYLGIHISTKEKVAIKIIDKEEIFYEEINKKRLLIEISILKKVRHKNIIKLYEIMETPQTIYLVMEYCNNGELFDYIVSKEKLNEKTACLFYQEIIDALSYLHSLNIVHRDIKPENILLNKINKNIDCKIIDFGISRSFESHELIKTPCGTASYAPPEMHNGELYNPILSDIWSSGVLLFAMVCGYLPFDEDDEFQNIKNIIKGYYEFPDEELSTEVKDLINHLLDINPRTRYNIDQIKQHPWFNLVKPNFRPGIIIGYHRIPIDPKIIALCEEYGYNKDEVIESVEKNRYDKNSSVYYILLKRLENKGIESISDLYSDKYLEYINDKNNILSEEEMINFKQNENEENENRKLNNEEESKKDKSSSDNENSERSLKEINSNENDNNEKDNKSDSENGKNKEINELNSFTDDKNEDNNIEIDLYKVNKEEFEEINKQEELVKNNSEKELNSSILDIKNKNEDNLQDLNNKEINKEEELELKNMEDEKKEEELSIKNLEKESTKNLENIKNEENLKENNKKEEEINIEIQNDKNEKKENEKEILENKEKEIEKSIKKNSVDKIKEIEKEKE